ncbi:RDD family protein [Patulibacter sp. NPDC049589]|uniref:RDD family protein n=1 Tax=Patulibacter sp. NPDC049589 TaxID=3154731 RepID=UPI00342102DF
MPGPASFPPPAPGAAPLAGLGQRFAAVLLDGAIVFAIDLVVVAVALVLSAVGATILGVALAVLGWLVVPFVYTPVLLGRPGARNGQTWGKQVLGVRVLRVDGQPLTSGTGFLRLLCTIIPLYFVWALFEPLKQGLHDKIAGTVVVVAGPATPPPSTPVGTPAPPYGR